MSSSTSVPGAPANTCPGVLPGLTQSRVHMLETFSRSCTVKARSPFKPTSVQLNPSLPTLPVYVFPRSQRHPQRLVPALSLGRDASLHPCVGPELALDIVESFPTPIALFEACVEYREKNPTGKGRGKKRADSLLLARLDKGKGWRPRPMGEVGAKRLLALFGDVAGYSDKD
jgi:hypothetical protein